MAIRSTMRLRERRPGKDFTKAGVLTQTLWFTDTIFGIKSARPQLENCVNVVFVLYNTLRYLNKVGRVIKYISQEN